jgi:hypothetical protein
VRRGKRAAVQQSRGQRPRPVGVHQVSGAVPACRAEVEAAEAWRLSQDYRTAGLRAFSPSCPVTQGDAVRSTQPEDDHPSSRYDRSAGGHRRSLAEQLADPAPGRQVAASCLTRRPICGMTGWCSGGLHAGDGRGSI